MSFPSLRRTLDTLTFSSAGQQTIDIPRGYLLRDIEFRLAGNVSIGTITTTGTLVSQEPLSLIKQIDIIGNGSQLLKRVDGRGAYSLNAHYDGQAGELTALTAAGAQTATAIAASFHIDFVQPERYSLKPIDTVLDTRLYSSLQLRVTYGTVEDIVYASTPAPTFSTTPTIQAITNEVNGPDGLLFPYFRTYFLDTDMPSTNANFPVKLDVGPQVLRSLMVLADVGTPPAGNDSVINKFSLLSNGVYRHLDQLPYAITRQKMKQEFDLGTLLAGYTLFDFAEDGMLTRCIDLSDLTDLKLILDTTKQTGTNTIRVFVSDIVPVGAGQV
jgi:hypothetical protein